MRQRIITIILLIAAITLCSNDVMAQKRKYPEFHYVTLPISAGYSSMLSPGFKNENPNFKVPGLMGATIGFGYEYRYRMFWMSLGVEGQLITSRLRAGMERLDTMMYDTDSYYHNEQRENTYHYDFSDWHEDLISVYGNVPIMFGFRANAFYVGIGAKVGYNFYATTTPKSTYTTSSTYDRYIIDFQNMPNHYLTQYNSGVTGDGKDVDIKLGLNVSAIAEIGYEVYHSEGDDKVRPWILKLGAYAEYGFLSVYNNNGDIKSQFDYKQAEQESYNCKDPSQLLICPYYKSHSMQNVNVNPLYIGAKLTFMFEMPVPQKCHCLQTDRGASWRNLAPKETRNQDRRAKKAVKKQKQKNESESSNSTSDKSGR
ncbi:MAG: hypothetical protein MJZ95_03215 [Paludibacteraceae bacterium]|nr:hypothetical protein [Paludibacteraceae bacterium]